MGDVAGAVIVAAIVLYLLIGGVVGFLWPVWAVMLVS